MTSEDLSYAAIVVGSGAAGTWAAMDLASRGLDVLLLEAGPLEDEQVAEVAREDWPRRYPVQSTSPGFGPATARYFADDLDNPYFAPADAPFAWLRCRHQSGRMNVWARVAVRFGPGDFTPASDGYGEDWPISYADLEPHYPRVEEELAIRGAHDGLSHYPDGVVDATRSMTALEERFKAAIEARWPSRRVIQARVATARFGALIDKARKTGRLTLRGRSIARSVCVGSTSDRAEGVEFFDARTRSAHVARAPVIVLCASSFESTRLLLASRSKHHSRGLGNSSGMLGRAIMDHSFLWRFKGSIAPSAHAQGEEADGVSILVPRFANMDEGRRSYRRGYQLQGVLRERLSEAEVAFWGQVGKKTRERGLAFFNLIASGEVLPRPENRLTVEESKVDAFGVPIPRIELRYGENERLMADDQRSSVREMLMQVPGLEILEEVEPQPPGLSAHELGGARMGSDPKTSVVDPHQRLWDVPNVFVTDGACFPTSPCQNPTLTIMAITARACAFIDASRRS
jgi:choline dehydrogenase-like flavoprotein